MKNFSFLLRLFDFSACQSKDTTATPDSKSDTTKYPCTVKDTTALKELIGDSIGLIVDGYEFNGLKANFLKTVQQEMNK